ncbi:hypothetical protein [Diaphorobacter caeni]|uniref:hypothetical protein n=1 Tax=Diaphorobacter caeni TaxID=2784387 RepID=UPI00188E9DB6|nr:hypothetical protein [Diaphorobacter caeni]MBF5003427.1 hypothetical protein [Diaphorobacter caeni]
MIQHDDEVTFENWKSTAVASGSVSPVACDPVGNAHNADDTEVTFGVNDYFFVLLIAACYFIDFSIGNDASNVNKFYLGGFPVRAC